MRGPGDGGRAIGRDELEKYRVRRVPDGYPDDQRTFIAPRDDIYGLLVALLASAQHSIVVNMFGYDDDELNRIIQGKLADDDLRADEPGPPPGR